jgi:uncharacterized membrane protein
MQQDAGAGWKPGVIARWLGIVEIVLAGCLVALVTLYHLRDDSSMAAVAWLYSFPVALLFLALPGILLRKTRWLGWAVQVLPVGFVLWICAAAISSC